MYAIIAWISMILGILLTLRSLFALGIFGALALDGVEKVGSIRDVSKHSSLGDGTFIHYVYLADDGTNYSGLQYVTSENFRTLERSSKETVTLDVVPYYQSASRIHGVPYPWIGDGVFLVLGLLLTGIAAPYIRFQTTGRLKPLYKVGY